MKITQLSALWMTPWRKTPPWCIQIRIAIRATAIQKPTAISSGPPVFWKVIQIQPGGPVMSLSKMSMRHPPSITPIWNPAAPWRNRISPVALLCVQPHNQSFIYRAALAKNWISRCPRSAVSLPRSAEALAAKTALACSRLRLLLHAHQDALLKLL